MTIVGVIGDCTTTTCVALTAAWSIVDAVILEADPSGGSLTGWLDTPTSPSLATIVANTGSHHTGVGETIEALTQRSASGIRFIAAPIRSIPAHRAIEEAETTVIPWLTVADTVVFADVGRHHGADRLPIVMNSAATTLVVHRQEPSSPGAAAVRLERLVETVAQIARLGTPLVLAVIGHEPFDPEDVARFVDESSPGTLDAFVRLADDTLSAAVLAGREGVSAKRLRRLPLMRTASDAVPVLQSTLGARSAMAHQEMS